MIIICNKIFLKVYQITDQTNENLENNVCVLKNNCISSDIKYLINFK